MSTPDAPSPAWYPDPTGQPQLRWWDGATWTEHIAPDPVAQPAPSRAVGPANVGPLSSREPYGAAPWVGPGYAAGPRQKVFTRGTWATLAVTALVVGIGVGGAAWGAASADAALRAEAPAVLDGFLDAVASGDADWTEYASPALAGRFPAGSAPLLGNTAAAELIDLDVSFEVGDLIYRESGYNRDEGAESNPVGADSAAAPMTVTYTFSVDGEKQTATATEMVWLTRPYYFGEDDTPKSADEGGSPSAVGPWRVSGVTLPQNPRDEPLEPGGTSTYAPAATEGECTVPDAIVISHSEIARVNGYIPALCLSADDRTTWGETVDLDALAAGFPLLNDSVPLIELVGLGNSYDDPAPLVEYVVSASDGDYVYVFAATGPEVLGDRSEYRIIAVERMQ